MNTTEVAPVNDKVQWVTRPWHKDWIFWVFMFFWTVFSWQLMFSRGRLSSIAWAPALINLVIELLTSFATTFVVVALPLLIVRRIVRGHLAKKALSEGRNVRDYGRNEPRGWGVWLFVAVTIMALLFWFVGRNQNPLINITEGRGVTAAQVNPDLLEQLEALRFDPDELAQSLVETFEQKPGFKAQKAYEAMQATLAKYFAEDVNSGDITATFDRLRGYLNDLQESNAILASNLDLVTSQSDMPSVSPDANLLRDFSAAMQPWLDARISYYAALDSCQESSNEIEFLDCEVAATDEWEPVMISTIPPLDAAARALD